MKRILIAFFLVPLLSLVGCGEQGRELVVGTYENEETIVFSDDSIKDETDINQFVDILEAGSPSENEVEGLPDYVVTINNPSESTMELMVNLWIDEDGSIQFTKGLAGDEIFEIDPRYRKDLNELLGLDNVRADE